MDALLEGLEKSGMSKQDVADFSDNVYCEKPNANIAGEILYRALKSNPKAKKTAKDFGINAKPYLNKTVIGLLIGGGIAIGVAASSGGNGDNGPSGPPGFGS